MDDLFVGGGYPGLKNPFSRDNPSFADAFGSRPFLERFSDC